MSDESLSSKDDQFVKPKIPFRKPTIDLNKKSDDKQVINSIENNDQEETLSNLKEQLITTTTDDQSQATSSQQDQIKKFPIALTQLQPIKDVFYLEEIKDGTVVKRHYLNNNINILGRATNCDIMFEHYSVSRYHAALYWKESSKDDYGFFYLIDLNSSHGTFHNKIQLEQNKFLKLQQRSSFIKLGASSRLLLFNCINEDEQVDENEEDVSSTDESKIHINFKEKNQQITKQRFDKDSIDSDCSWGLINNDDLRKSTINYQTESSNLQTVLEIINQNTIIDKTENENVYEQNPQKVIQNWFEYEGYEYEYKIENDNKFKCTISFPIDGEDVPISGEEEIKVRLFVFFSLI